MNILNKNIFKNIFLGVQSGLAGADPDVSHGGPLSALRDRYDPPARARGPGQ